MNLKVKIKEDQYGWSKSGIKSRILNIAELEFIMAYFNEAWDCWLHYLKEDCGRDDKDLEQYEQIGLKVNNLLRSQIKEVNTPSSPTYHPPHI